MIQEAHRGESYCHSCSSVMHILSLFPHLFSKLHKWIQSDMVHVGRGVNPYRGVGGGGMIGDSHHILARAQAHNNLRTRARSRTHEHTHTHTHTHTQTHVHTFIHAYTGAAPGYFLGGRKCRR